MIRYIAPSIVLLGLALPSSAHGDEHHPAGEEHPAGQEHAAKHEEKPATAHAHGDHAHASPHGGIVATIDKETHVEVAITDTGFSVWFYDADMKPLPLPGDAKASVAVGKFGKKIDLPVAKKADGSPDDHLLGAIEIPAGQKVAMVIQATVAGKARTARVERPAATPPTPAPAPAADKGTP